MSNVAKFNIWMNFPISHIYCISMRILRLFHLHLQVKMDFILWRLILRLFP